MIKAETWKIGAELLTKRVQHMIEIENSKLLVSNANIIKKSWSQEKRKIKNTACITKNFPITALFLLLNSKYVCTHKDSNQILITFIIVCSNLYSVVLPCYQISYQIVSLGFVRNILDSPGTVIVTMEPVADYIAQYLTISMFL